MIEYDVLYSYNNFGQGFEVFIHNTGALGYRMRFPIITFLVEKSSHKQNQ